MRPDYLTVTTPETSSGCNTDSCRIGFLEIVSQVGGVAFAGSPEQFRVGSSGTMNITYRSGVVIYRVSGDAITQLLAKGLWAELLWCFADVSHRVTRLDIALDIEEPTAPVIDRLFNQANGPEGISLTRKQIPPRSINKFLSMGVDGVETGTIYLGKKTSDAYAKVYDKRHERLNATGVDIGRPLTRYELTVTSRLCISLSDAYTPDDLFWHFMGNIMEKPSTAKPWVAGGTGFNLPPKVALLPAEKLRRRVESSVDLECMAQLASELGPEGLTYVLRLIRAKLESSPVVTLETPLRASEGS